MSFPCESYVCNRINRSLWLMPCALLRIKHKASCWWCSSSWYSITSPPSAAYMREWIGSALVQIMACHLFGAKPLPEPMLTYCQLDSWEQKFSEIWIRTLSFSFRKMHLKCCLPKWQPFCPGGDEVLQLLQWCVNLVWGLSYVNNDMAFWVDYDIKRDWLIKQFMDSEEVFKAVLCLYKFQHIFVSPIRFVK